VSVRPADEQVIAVVIAEAHRLICAGLRLLIECEGDMLVVGEAMRGETAVAQAQRLRPDVVVMDVGLPGIDALRATRLIFDDATVHGRVLLISTSGSEPDPFAALRAGAHGLLLSSSAPEELRTAARTVAAGGALLAPGLMPRLAADLVPGRARPGVVAPELEVLTGREREVVALVALGFSNAEIAARLAVSPATVKTHVGGAIAKLTARDRTALVTLAYETGLVVSAPRAAAPPPPDRRRRRGP
jgi:DNA-binding NarL/FixJ family response regulator